jgi:hypothetical protein
MKPKDHPEFFRLPPPDGTSRESTIRLDVDGRFWHDGALFEHSALERAFHQWIARHPDDGRYILTNGYDWTYFQVDDAPYFVRSLEIRPDGVALHLSDETTEDLRGETLRTGNGGALYVKVKDGRFEARFSRHAQTQLAPLVGEGAQGAVFLRIGSRDFAVP